MEHDREQMANSKWRMANDEGAVCQFLLMGAATLLATLLVIPGPFALAGLWGVAENAVGGLEVSWEVFWQNAKQYGPRNWGNTILILGFYALLGANFWFYNNSETSPFSQQVVFWLTAVWIALSVLWTGVAFYLLAFQLQMIEPKIFPALRNSFALFFFNPIDTFTWLLFLAALTALCVLLPPLVILLPGFTAVLSITAVKTLLKPFIEKRKAAESAQESE
jgi:uncharacterized membrane protein YesL